MGVWTHRIHRGDGLFLQDCRYRFLPLLKCLDFLAGVKMPTPVCLMKYEMLLGLRPVEIAAKYKVKIIN